MNRKKLVRNSSLQKAAEFSGVAGEFRCLSLHRLLSPELFLQLAVSYLNHGRSAMWAAVRKVAEHQVLEQLFDFGQTQIVVRLNCVTAYSLGDDVLAHSQTRSGRGHRTEFIDELPDCNARIICSKELGNAVDLQSGIAKRLQRKPHLFESRRVSR